MSSKFDLKALLDIIFKATEKSADIMADNYLLKDKSIISEWEKSAIVPGNDDIQGIIKFVLNESTDTQQQTIRDNIEQLVKESALKKELKEAILSCGDLTAFLSEAISVSISTSENKYGLETLEQTDIELNLRPVTKMSTTLNFIKKTYVLGLIILCVVSGSLITYSNNQKNKSVNSNNPQDSTIDITPIDEPTATAIVTPKIIFEPTPSTETISTPVVTPNPTNDKDNEVNTDKNKDTSKKGNTNYVDIN